jgi:hypothetical protein
VTADERQARRDRLVDRLASDLYANGVRPLDWCKTLADTLVGRGWTNTTTDPRPLP